MSRKTQQTRYFTNSFLTADVSEKIAKPDFWMPIIKDYIDLIKSKCPSIPKNADSGLYVGTPGIAYMFLHASKSPVMQDMKEEYIAKGIEYCESGAFYTANRNIDCPSDYCGFLLGNSGLSAIATVLYDSARHVENRDKQLEIFSKCSEYCKDKYTQDFGYNELLVGRAGYLMGSIWIENVLQKRVLQSNVVNDIFKCIIDEGRDYARKTGSISPLMYHYYRTEYLGAAHGLSGILQVLLSVSEFTNMTGVSEIMQSIDYILSLQSAAGNFPSESNERLDEKNYGLIHWCHGAPGVIYLMAKAYIVSGNSKYLQSCVKCADLIWEKGLLKKGPGICHGIAGSGYAFLLMYRLTKDAKYLHRAVVFAEFMLSSEFKEARTPDNPYSLYEGLAGTVCFLLDLLHPENASFPFMNIFDNLNRQ